MGKILVAGKRLNLGVRGPGEKFSWRETRSSGTGDSHPGQESFSVSGGEDHIPQSLGTKGNQEGWPSWVECRSVGTGDPHSGVDIFPDLSPRAKPYLLWVKVQLGVALPCHGLWSMGRQGTQSPHSRRRIKSGSCRQRELYFLLLWDFASDPTKVKDDTSCLDVSYGLVLAKSLGTSKMVHLGVFI